MADTLEDLAARCESATGRDRELDDVIFKVMGFCKHRNRHFEPSDDPDELLGPEVCDDCGKRGSMAYRLLLYTLSLDAAMTLVPEGWYWRVGHSTLYAGWASINRLHPDHCNPNDETFAKAATPALALAAAALRAIAKERG